MITAIPIERPDAIQRVRDEYLGTLAAPMDGMWERAVIAQASFREICDDGRHAGHFCVGPDNGLLRFHLAEGYRARAPEIFDWMIATYDIRHAIASTIEPLYLSLCLAIQESIATHSYLFRDDKRREMSSALDNYRFRKVNEIELHDIVYFYRANTDGAGEWIEPFLHERLTRDELFGLYDRQALIATGECIPSPTQPPYADLGMVVARAYRGRGLGSAMLVYLKQRCYQAGWEPICSCAADNGASKKAIERAGFVSEQRMVAIAFARDGDPQAPR